MSQDKGKVVNDVLARAMQRRHSNRESAKTDYVSMNSGKAAKPRTSLEGGEARLLQETEEFIRNIEEAMAGEDPVASSGGQSARSANVGPPSKAADAGQPSMAAEEEQPSRAAGGKRDGRRGPVEEPPMRGAEKKTS